MQCQSDRSKTIKKERSQSTQSGISAVPVDFHNHHYYADLDLTSFGHPVVLFRTLVVHDNPAVGLLSHCRVIHYLTVPAFRYHCRVRDHGRSLRRRFLGLVHFRLAFVFPPC
jgi:hypothetical protein